ncbi:FxSxx-COOH system tetratricopeptide repeat protein [Streptomyces globisporus]|uniref:FxSxx-COOH system tetratricopeptide repeat protein n=1 Tax=Streptomyces globisporus TaxID=1908 RepID=UPI00345FC553
MTDIKQRFFISYAGPDRVWAEWVGWRLKRAGHEIELDRWDWPTGDDFIQRMNLALSRADATVALFSRNYFADGRWTQEEWASSVAKRGRLVPVAIEPLADDDIPALLAGRLYQDLHGLDETAATAALLEAVNGPKPPAGPVTFPGGTLADSDTDPAPQRPRLPSSVGLPEVWNVRRRNPDFSGREADLVRLRTGLLSGHHAVIQALHGMGGIGKTQIASEYAHRFASQYDLVWWVDAEQADQLPVRFTELADRLGITKSDAGPEANARALLQHLRTRHRWLLILDNAEQPDQIEPWLPEGPGHVLITSRNPDWHGIAQQNHLDVFTRSDSLAYLQTRLPGIATEQADLLAKDLGDLPLALAQAAGVLRSGLTLERYRQLLATNTARLLQESDVRDYPAPLVATVDIAVTRLRDNGHVDAAALLLLGAFLGPDPIPTAWLEAARPGLRTTPGDANDVMWLRKSLQPLGRYGLARTEFDAFQIHRLTQAILRTRTSSEQAAVIHDDITTVLTAVDPGDPESPADWPSWASLTAHLTTFHVAEVVGGRTELRRTLCTAIDFLLRSGQPRTAYDLSSALHQRWSAELGPDHADTLTCAQYVGHASSDLGSYAEARTIIEDAFSRRRRVLGEEHPDTLQSAHDAFVILSYLGEYAEARTIIESAHSRRRRALGDDHPDTLQSAQGLAASLHHLGMYAEARRLQEDVLARRRRVLGEEHPSTLESAHNLAASLHSLGMYAEDRRLQEDVLTRRRRVLGEEHPSTLESAQGLAASLHAMGEYAEDRRLQEDVLTRRRRVLGEEHPHTLQSSQSLASTVHSLGDYEEARRMKEDVLARRRRILGEEHPHTLQSSQSLANTLHSLGDYEEARRMKEDVLARRRRILGEEHPEAILSMHSLAATLYELRDPQALELLRDAYHRCRRALGEKHPDTAGMAKSLSVALKAMGRTYEAQQLSAKKPQKTKRRSGRKRR